MASLGSLTVSLGVDLKALGEAEKRLGAFAQKAGKRMTKLGKTMSLKVTAPLVLLGGVATKAAIDFESAFTGVRKTVEATEEEFQVLRKGLMALAREIPISTEEIFGIAEAAGQLGIAQEDILGFTKVMADLGATTNLSANEAATSLARFSTVMGTSSDDVDKLGSTIVALGNNLATTEREIVDMSLRLTGASSLIGLTEPQVLALAGALSSVGIRAEQGGTAFSRVMKEIDKSIGTTSREIELFAEISGKSVDAFEAQWKKGPADALLGFVEGLARTKLEGKNVNIVLEELGLQGIRISDSLLRTALSGDKLRKAMGLANKAWEENNALTEEANLRYETTESQLTIAQNKAEQLAASFGEILAPALIKVIDELEPLMKWLEELDPKTKETIIVIAGLAAVVGPLAIVLGSLASVVGFLLAPFGLVTAAVIALGVAVVVAIKEWETIRDFWVDFFSGLDFVELGKQMIFGLITGIKLAAGGLTGAIIEVISLAIQNAKNLLGISSPSKVFTKIGENVIQGFAGGIKDGGVVLQTALADILKNIGNDIEVFTKKNEESAERVKSSWEKMSKDVADATKTLGLVTAGEFVKQADEQLNAFQTIVNSQQLTNDERIKLQEALFGKLKALAEGVDPETALGFDPEEALAFLEIASTQAAEGLHTTTKKITDDTGGLITDLNSEAANKADALTVTLTGLAVDNANFISQTESIVNDFINTATSNELSAFETRLDGVEEYMDFTLEAEKTITDITGGEWDIREGFAEDYFQKINNGFANAQAQLRAYQLQVTALPTVEFSTGGQALGTFHSGGVVPGDGLYNLQAGEEVIPLNRTNSDNRQDNRVFEINVFQQPGESTADFVDQLDAAMRLPGDVI